MQKNIAFVVLILCWLQYGTAQQQGDIRLVNGSTYSGRLEIYKSTTEEWLTICINGFTMLSANTACKQLGRVGAVSFGQAETLGYGVGTGGIGLTQVQCGEDDNHILRCSAMGVGTITSTTCDHVQDVGINCLTEPAFQYEGGVRLVGGPYSSEGILEVFIFNTWYTICTESLPEDAATAVCTQLGYTNNVRTTTRSLVDTTSVWRTSPECNFTTSCFSRCYTRPSKNSSVVNNCSSNTYIHITCGFNSQLAQTNLAGITAVCYLGPAFDTTLRQGDLRLQGGDQTSGRLEIYDRVIGEWGTICKEGFTLESANTACRQLGYERALEFGSVTQLRYTPGNGAILLTKVQCVEAHNHILRCSTVAYSPLVDSCAHTDDIGIRCENRPALEYEGSVRLVDGPYRSEGRLEIFIFDEWYSPCTVDFHDDAATAVCQQLGYTSSIGYNIISQVVDATPWEVSTLTCDSILPACFSRCYVRPLSMSVLDQTQSCPSFTFVYVRCDFDPSLVSVPFGDIFQCYLGPFPTPPTEPTPPPPTPPGTIAGITIGAIVFVVIVCLFILHKNGKLKELRQRWDRFIANTRRRISSWNPRNRVRHRPRPSPNVAANATPATNPQGNATSSNASASSATSNAASTSDTNATSTSVTAGTHDSNKPPNYEEALTYRKSEVAAEGYPEPSLVDGPQPPSYDAVY